MRIQNNNIHLKLLLLLVSSLFFAPFLKAQFTITEDFKKSITASDIILGGSASGRANAYLTSGNNYSSGDNAGDGWLRLTEAEKFRTGYAYIDQSFPSNMGVYIEFEYKAWRHRWDYKDGDNYNSWGGADGFSVFLFNASTPFRIGGTGGSLGYANYKPDNTTINTPGLAGGYIGIGIDEFGNYVTKEDGKVGGKEKGDQKPNSITLRGSETSGYAYLNHIELNGGRWKDSERSVDYNEPTSSRPSDATFYRKVKITIEPIGTDSQPKYKITVFWTTDRNSNSYTTLFDYETTERIPDRLKIGFAASTGSGFNNHEIRNLFVTTPGDVLVKKGVDKVNAAQTDDLIYTVDVINNSTAIMSGLTVNDVIKDGEGNDILHGSTFSITSVTFLNGGEGGNTAVGFTNGLARSWSSNTLNATLTLQPNSTATFTIKGKLNGMPAGGKITNRVEITPPFMEGIHDDPTNNSSEVSTKVYNPALDLKIEKTADHHGAARTGGNTFAITVTNNSNVVKQNGNPVTVTDLVPAGLTVTNYTGKPTGDGLEAHGWSTETRGDTYLFTRADDLNGLASYPPILIEVTASAPTALSHQWTNSATVEYIGDTDPTNNTAEADLKWYNYWHGTTDTDWAKTDNWTASYVPATGQDIEFATDDNNGPDGDGNGQGTAKNDLHLDKDRIIGDLINKSDKDLIVTIENQLVINEQVRSDNTGGIVVKADPNKASGTLIFKKPFFNSNVDATVQFYNKAFECADCGFYRKQWQYFGVPVKSGEFPFADVTGTETVNRWDETYNGDKWRPTTGALSAFAGYQITNDAKTEPTEVYNFEGKLNVGDASVALTKTPSVNYSGTNLVSNSYTAAIPISTDAMTFPSGAEQTVYLFNTGTRDQWRKLNGQAINQDGYRSGQYLAVPVNLGGQGNFPDRIPSTHAFLLQTTASGTLNINYSKLIKNTAVSRGDGTQIVTRSVDSNNNTSTSEQVSAIQQLPSLVMDVIGEESADRVWIFQQSSATHDFDNGLDGRKLLEDGIAQLYVNAADDSKLQVATVPELKDVTLGFVPDRDGKFTLDFLMSGQLKGVDIYLYDSLNDTTTKVGDGQSYSFSAKKGDSQNRFSLTSSAKNAFLSIDESLLEVTSTTGGKIMVVNNSSKVLSAFVYDSNGAFVQRVEVDANGKATIKDGLIKGMYMVRLQNSEVNDVRRVIVE